MPVNSANQGIPEQQGADPANLPSAQVSWDGVMENRLVQRYTNLADRTARNPAPNENEVSALASEDRVEVFNTADWVSLYSRTLYAQIRKTADQSISSTTTLTNDSQFVVPLPTAGTFGWEHWLFYDSSISEDIVFAYTWPAGATVRWGGLGILDTGAGGTTGSVKNNTGTSSGVGLAYGGAGVGSIVSGMIFGEITMGGTSGNLQFQFAQNSSAATNTTIRARSRLLVWRIV